MVRDAGWRNARKEIECQHIVITKTVVWRYRKTITLPCGRKKSISGTPPVNTKVAAQHAERQHINRCMNGLDNPKEECLPERRVPHL